MNLRPEQLAAQLDKPLAPLYVLHGNEPLLVLEAGDAIRAAARKQGYAEREVLVAGQGFRWTELQSAAGNLSLFGASKLVDLRIPNGKPGRDGGEALQRYHDFHRLIYDGSPLQVTAQGGLLSIRWSELPQNMTAQITDETAIALMIGFLKHFMDFKNIRLHAVHFQSAAPKHAALYAQYFGCKVRFSQPCSEVLLPVQELSAPFQQGDQTLQQLLTQQAQSLLQKLPHSTQTDQRLQQAILTGLQKNQFQIEHIAGQLNIPVRQLQRHLQQQGASYQQRMQEVRCMLAEEYLRDPHLSLQEIALLLGYSEQSAFQRAFKRWLQLTPQQWRRQNLPAR